MTRVQKRRSRSVICSDSTSANSAVAASVAMMEFFPDSGLQLARVDLIALPHSVDDGLWIGALCGGHYLVPDLIGRR